MLFPVVENKRIRGCGKVGNLRLKNDKRGDKDYGNCLDERDR